MSRFQPFPSWGPLWPLRNIHLVAIASSWIAAGQRSSLLGTLVSRIYFSVNLISTLVFGGMTTGITLP